MFAFCYSIVIKILRQWSYVYSIKEAFITLIKGTVSCTANDTSACENTGSKDGPDISYFIPRKPVYLMDASDTAWWYKHLQSSSFVWPLSSPPLPQEFSEEADRGW